MDARPQDEARASVELADLRARLAETHATCQRLLADLQQKHKLEAVGELAEGIAHEINTPTQYVSDNVHFLEEAFGTLGTLRGAYRDICDRFVEPARRDEMRGALESAEEEADVEYLVEHVPKAIHSALGGLERIARLVTAMKEHGHRDGATQAAADINRILSTTLEVARNEYKYVADVQTDLGELVPVVCFGGELHQVFLNLVVNASHAIADVVGASSARGHLHVTSRLVGDEVVVEIRDDGAGIPEAVRPRIFEPFFTTKEVGRGTGQGLAIAHAVVVERHRGTLTFDSEVGRGTTFRVTLPVGGAHAAEDAEV